MPTPNRKSRGIRAKLFLSNDEIICRANKETTVPVPASEEDVTCSHCRNNLKNNLPFKEAAKMEYCS